MPYAFLHIKPNLRGHHKEEVANLRRELPAILSEELAVEGSIHIHEGALTPAEIMVWPVGDDSVINGKDIEIVVFAHPFPKRFKNREQRKDAVIRRLTALFEETHASLTFAVCIIMAPMAYGEARVINPMP